MRAWVENILAVAILLAFILAFTLALGGCSTMPGFKEAPPGGAAYNVEFSDGKPTKASAYVNNESENVALKMWKDQADNLVKFEFEKKGTTGLDAMMEYLKQQSAAMGTMQITLQQLLNQFNALATRQVPAIPAPPPPPK